MSHLENHNDCFEDFDSTSKIRDKSVKALFDYEKHYLELVKRYSSEITLIDNMLKNLRHEQSVFYNQTLKEVIDKLSGDKAIDEGMRKAWLDRFVANVERSFSLSDHLINEFAIKKLRDFKAAVIEKMKTL